MAENHMEIWNALKQPPPTALKEIKGGRLKGMSDINPQWRYQAMTEQFGMCGKGWKYEIIKLWIEHATNGLICAFAEIKLYVWIESSTKPSGWSEAIPGVGGSMLVAKELAGPYVSDEAFKMAVTDALSVAMKMLGVAADIYAGLWDGSKYRDAPQKQASKKAPPTKATGSRKTGNEMSGAQWNLIKKLGSDLTLTEEDCIYLVKWVAKEHGLDPRSQETAKLILGKDDEVPKQIFQTWYAKYIQTEIERTER